MLTFCQTAMLYNLVISSKVSNYLSRIYFCQVKKKMMMACVILLFIHFNLSFFSLELFFISAEERHTVLELSACLSVLSNCLLSWS